MRNRFHALCPYFAMFPESFAEDMINRYTKPGEYVLDPFSGRGTTATQALLMGRKAIASDVNPVAWCLSRAKTAAPPLASVHQRIQQLEDQGKEAVKSKAPTAFFKHAFTPQVYGHLAFLRGTLDWKNDPVDTMVAALVLGILHGEAERSDRYLSAQMPRTISTKPDYSVRWWKEGGHKAPRRQVFARLRDEASYRYESPRPRGRADVYLADFRDLHRLRPGRSRKASLVVTSPPYFDTTNFEEDQWLRLWFLGGKPAPSPGTYSSDDRHTDLERYWSLLASMWDAVSTMVEPSAHVVVRLGSSRVSTDELREGLVWASGFASRDVKLVESNVSEIKGRQTRAFRPGSKGCMTEIDCHFLVS